MLAVLMSLTLAVAPGVDLQQQIQTAMNEIANASGFSFSVGVKDASLSFGLGAGPRSPKGLSPVSGNVSGIDTMLLGSGTKPYTAAAVMRLVEKGTLSLDDRATKHIDPVLQRMNGTSLVGLFGPPASNITVGHLLSMASGIGDFDIPTFDNELLRAGGSVHSILEPLAAVAAFMAPNGCYPSSRSGTECIFVCAPGTCVSCAPRQTERWKSPAAASCEPFRWFGVRSRAEQIARPTTFSLVSCSSPTLRLGNKQSRPSASWARSD
jgi:hypothetical protein